MRFTHDFPVPRKFQLLKLRTYRLNISWVRRNAIHLSTHFAILAYYYIKSNKRITLPLTSSRIWKYASSVKRFIDKILRW